MVVVVLVVVVVVVCVATHNQQRHSDIGVASRSRSPVITAILMARRPGPAACRGGDMLPAPSPIHIFVRRTKGHAGRRNELP